MDFVMVNRLDPGDDEHLENLIKYISDNRKLAIGGNGVDYHDPENALAQMQAVTEYFDKSHRCNGVQMIVAFDDHISISPGIFSPSVTTNPSAVSEVLSCSNTT